MAKRKGVSEIIATVLMIMIVTLIGFTVLLYGMGYFSGTTSARNQANAVTIAGLEERFVIVDINFTVNINASGNYTNVNVTVYNYGQITIHIGAMYLNGTALRNVNSTAINPNSVQSIIGNYTTDTGVIQTGYSQDIRVVSTLGNFYENYYQR